MRRFTLSIVPGILITVLVALFVGLSPVAALAYSGVTASNGGKWHIVPTPNVGSSNSSMYALAAISANDIWMVGLSYPNKVLATSSTLTEHWNGSRWSIVPSPNVGSHSNHLYGVAAVSSNDVWAVGDSYIDQRGSGGRTLIEHWNGTSWNVVPSPNPGNRFSELYAAAAVSANDVWAIGNIISLNPYLDQTLVEHWNGTCWSVVKSANPGVSDNTLEGITVVSANDIWAVGNFSKTNGHNQTLTEHWNGSSWSVVPSPNVGRFPNFLDGVTAVSTDNIWAVGYRAVSPGNIDYTLIEHWNGRSWSVVPSPNPQNAGNYLSGVAAVSSNSIWAVGFDYGFTSNAVTLVEHWNGSSWSVVPSPNRQPPSDSLGAVAALSAHNIWAIGDHLTPGLTFQTLAEHYY